MRIAIVPSNQHLNRYLGIPVTEEKWSLATSAWVVRRLHELGHTVESFHVPGAGSSSTDELSVMLARVVYWRPDYTLSIHSDSVGDSATTGILMLMARESDRAAGRQLGQYIANAIGLPYKGAWVYGVEARRINYLLMLRANSMRGSLVEVGEHSTTREAAWNWRHVQSIGIGIAEALHVHLGGTLTAPEPQQPEDDDMSSPEVLAVLQSMAADLKEIRAKLHTHVYQSEARGVIANALLNGDDETALKEALRVAPTATGYRPIG